MYTMDTCSVQNSVDRVMNSRMSGQYSHAVTGLHITLFQVITNEGSGFNIHTGVFTCPETGMYLFSFSIGERGNAQQSWASLKVNSENIINAVAETLTETDDDQGSNTVVIRLQDGDSVWVSGNYDNHHVEGSEFRISSFTGVFLFS